MPTTKEHALETRDWLRMRELASSRGWLSATLRHQQKLFALIDDLGRVHDASAWMLRWTALQQAVSTHLEVEEAVLAPVILAMGQRAHAVVAEVRREQIRRRVEDLRCPSWEDGGDRLQQMSLNLLSHFSQEESWSYRALARFQDEAAGAALTARCLAVLDNASTRPPDAGVPQWGRA